MLFPKCKSKMTGERRRRKGCSSNKHKVVEEVEKRNLEKSRADGVE